MNPKSNKIRKTSAKKWPWLVIGAIGLGLILFIVGLVLFARPNQQPDASYSPTTSANSPNSSQGTPSSYSATGNCQTQSNCTGPQNQTQGQGQPPTPGTISALSDTSISIQPANGGAVVSFKINSATRIMKSNGSQPYSTNDLQVGQTVTVAPTLQDKTVADFIALDNTGRLNQVPN